MGINSKLKMSRTDSNQKITVPYRHMKKNHICRFIDENNFFFVFFF